MPPPHRFLASRLQGYVCRACLSKSQVNLRQQPKWLSRKATDGRQPLRSKGVTQEADSQGLEIRLFEQGPDGTRVEIPTDFWNGIEEELGDYGKDQDKSIEELAGEVDFESLQDVDSEHRSYDPKLRGSLETMTKQTEELEALVERLENIDLSILSADERDKLREELLQTATTDEPPPTEIVAEPPRAPYRKSVTQPATVNLVPVELFNKEYRPHIWDLNEAIFRCQNTAKRSSAHIKTSAAKNVWKAYLRCQDALRSLPDVVPLRAWDILWEIFNTGSESNMQRMRQIKALGEDIRGANIPLSPPRLLLYIESIFISGDKIIAFREWQAAQYLTKDQSHSKEYYGLGIRMFCSVGDLEHALQTAETCLGQDSSHFRILLPIIQAYLNSKGEYSVQCAWALYIRMKFNFGPQMIMEDYDAVTSMFLTVNQLDLALGIFMDMMLTGSMSAAKEDSTAQYRKVVGVDQLGSVTFQDRELNWKNSRTLANLPAQFNNRYFFGSWIKKLIGEGKLDAAKQVFDLMQARRIKPDSRHMNGLIGAWFRQKYEGSRILAEDMAWRMIRARLEFVSSRKAAATYDLANHTRVVETKGLPSNKPVALIPSATIETFAILIEQYRRRQKPELIPGLLDAMRNAQVRPSTYFMNQLLLCDTKAHRTDWAWDTYYSLSRETGVQPDFDTYEILWNCMKKATEMTSARQRQSFASCRRLFADMMERGGKEGLPQDIYDLIILSFSSAVDQTGTAVALRALQQRFGMYPTLETTRTIVLQLARLGLTDEAGKKPKRLNMRSPLTKERIANVTKVLEMFREQRIDVLSQQGIEFEELSPDAKAEEMLLLLSDLLRYVAHARISAEERHNYNAAIAAKTAAEQMGVPDCVPWVAHDVGELEVV